MPLLMDLCKTHGMCKAVTRCLLCEEEKEKNLQLFGGGKLESLIELKNMCKCGVHLTINAHRDYYETVQQTFDNMARLGNPIEVEPEVKDKMIESDTAIQLHFYPDTPIGFYSVWHYDLKQAVHKALEIIIEERGLKQQPQAEIDTSAVR